MGRVIRLIDLLTKPGALGQEATIYAREPWTPESLTIVEHEPLSGELPAEASRGGMSYFLEVFVAEQFLDD